VYAVESFPKMNYVARKRLNDREKKFSRSVNKFYDQATHKQQ